MIAYNQRIWQALQLMRADNQKGITSTAANEGHLIKGYDRQCSQSGAHNQEDMINRNCSQ